MQGLDLDRVTDHGKIAGVCAGVATRWQIDPLLVRIGAVILALCSGIGAVVYGAAWLLLPTRGGSEAPLMAHFPKAKQVPAVGWYVIVGALCLVAMGTLGQVMPISTGPVLAVAALWYFGIYRPGKRRAQNARQTTQGPGTAPAPHADHTFAPYDPQPRFGLGVEPEGYPDQWPTSSGATPPQPAATPRHGAPHTSPWHPDASRPGASHAPAGHSDAPHDPAGRAPGAHLAGEWTGEAAAPTTTLTRTGAVVGPDAHTARRVRTIAIAAVAAAVIGLAVLDGAGLVTVPLLGYAATALLIVGIALVVSAWTGRARGLLPLGCLMLALTVIGIGNLADASDNPRFTQSASYATVADIPGPQSFDVAEVRVDMSGLDLDRDATYTVTVDSGTVVVTVPHDANVVVNARVDVGTINALEQQRDGLDQQGTFESHPNPGGPVLTLDLAVDVGAIRVVRS